MQQVSANLLAVLRRDWRDLIPVVEYYHFDAEPGADGFDPQQADFLLGFAAVGGINFRGRTYARKVNSFGDVRRSITQEFNKFSAQLNNQDRSIAAFHFSTGFEGLICVVRLVARSLTKDNNLADSIVLFVGRCEKPEGFKRSSESVRVEAKQIIGSTEITMPRRRFSPDDENGRHPDDPLFEGFRFSVQYGTVQYSVRERRGGLLGLLGLKKTVTKNLPYSSHSALDSEKALPEVFGRVQIAGHHIGYIDVGTEIRVLTAFCEGRIKDFLNTRSVTPGFTINPGAFAKLVGLVGGEPPDTGFVAPGFYSRTAHTRAAVNGTTAAQDDPAPDLVSVILGRLVDLPDAMGVFNQFDWTDNPVYLTRFVLATSDYFNLAANFHDDDINGDSANYCNGVLLDTSQSDAVYLPDSEAGKAGTDYKLLRPTSTVTPEYFRKLADLPGGDDVATNSKDVNYKFFAASSVPPIEPIEPPEGGGGGSGGGLQLPSFVLRRRYTANVAITEQQKAIDFLFNVLFPAARLYLVTTAAGKIGIRVARPVDNSILRADAAAGANSIAVFDVEPWRANFAGELLIGASLTTSERRTVTAANYTTASNAITLAATNLTASGATLTGANNSNSTASGTITVADTTGTKTVTINGFALSYAPVSGDTTETVAGFFSAAINGHPVLQKFISAVWTGNSVVTVYSKLGTLDLGANLSAAHVAGMASPTVAPTATAAAGGALAVGEYKLSYSFQNANGETLPSPQTTITVAANQKVQVAGVSLPAGALFVNWYFSTAGGTTMRLRRIKQNTGAAFEILTAPLRSRPIEPNYNATGEEIMRVAFAFSEKNMLAGSFEFPLGTKQPSINRVDLKFRDSVQDWKLTELRVKDSAHINRVKKVLPKEVSGAAIDNYHQAKRIANQFLAEWREGDFYTAFASDGEALLLEEGDVVTVSDASGGLINLPVRVESVNIKLSSGHPEISIDAKKYSKAFYSDDADERVLPIPTTLSFPRAGSPAKQAKVAASGDFEAHSFLVVTAAGATTFALPSAPTDAMERKIKNTGAGTATVTAIAPVTIFDSAAVASVAVAPGAVKTFRYVADGDFWAVI